MGPQMGDMYGMGCISLWGVLHVTTGGPSPQFGYATLSPPPPPPPPCPPGPLSYHRSLGASHTYGGAEGTITWVARGATWGRAEASFGLDSNAVPTLSVLTPNPTPNPNQD